MYDIAYIITSCISIVSNTSTNLGNISSLGRSSTTKSDNNKVTTIISLTADIAYFYMMYSLL